MLNVVNLSFGYQNKSLLHQIEFSVTAGQLLHLRGNNGSGKTTLLKLLAGLLQPQEGDICYDGLSIHKDRMSFQEKLCYVGHKVGLNPMLTIRENCFFDLHWGRRAVVLDHLLDRFGLQGLGDEPCYQLSAGQRRRVGLLRLLLTDARLWLLDEPFVALDAKSISMLMICMEDHLAHDGLIILTSHQPIPLRCRYQEYSL